MQAIVTKYLGPTNFRGSRVKASAQAGSIIINWDDALNSEENHDLAANKLAIKFGWLQHSRFIGYGELPDGTGTAYILARKK